MVRERPRILAIKMRSQCSEKQYVESNWMRLEDVRRPIRPSGAGDSEKGSGQKSGCHPYRNSLCDPRRPSDPIQSRVPLSQPSRSMLRPPWDAREISHGSQVARSCPTWLCDS